MLTKFFRHGNSSQYSRSGRTGGGNDVRKYLLEKDGQPRPNATVVRGDPDLTTEIINGIKNKSKYTSAVLSFAEKENPSEEQLQKIIDSFENTLFPNFDKDQYSSYWVKHTDKGRTELHCVFANVELQSGKALPVYYHANDKHLIDNWQEITNESYDNLVSPKSPEHKKLRTATKGFELKDGYDNKGKVTDKQLKSEIENKLLAYISLNENIKTKEDVIEAFKFLKYEVSRANLDGDTISIKNPEGGKNLKFKNGLYDKNFSRDILPEYKPQVQIKWDAKKETRLANYKADYESHLASRKNRLEKKFGKIDRTPQETQLTEDLRQIRLNNEPKFLAEIENQQINGGRSKLCVR